MSNWEIGDRVKFTGTDWCAEDTGTVIEIAPSHIWARWDSDGFRASFNTDDPLFIKIPATPEDKAVELLLSLGYTIKKG